MAIMFGGDETPPGMFSGTDATKKVHRLCSAQTRDRASRSKSSPTVQVGALVHERACPGIQEIKTYRLAFPNQQSRTHAGTHRLGVDKPEVQDVSRRVVALLAYGQHLPPS